MQICLVNVAIIGISASKTLYYTTEYFNSSICHWGEVGESGQKVQTSSYKKNKFWDVMYSMVITVNNTVLYIWKLLREQIIKVLIKRKKICNYAG